MMKRMILAAALAGISTGALAADLLSHKAAPVLEPVSAPYQPFTWGGLYVGVNGGYTYGALSNSNFANIDTGLVGGALGYNLQMGQLVLGAEGDIGYAMGYKDHQFDAGSNQIKLGWLTTERLRLGFAEDRALFYVTGGYAGVQTRSTVNDNLGNTYKEDHWRSGGALGGGIEYAFSSNISAKAEYLWAPVQSKTYWAGTPDAETNSLSLSIARAGLNYKF